MSLPNPKQYVTIGAAGRCKKVPGPCAGNAASTSIKKISFEFDKACVISGVSLCCGFGKTALSTGSLNCFSRSKACCHCCFSSAKENERIAQHLQPVQNSSAEGIPPWGGGGHVWLCV